MSSLCFTGCTTLNDGAQERLYGSSNPSLARGGAGGSMPSARGGTGATPGSPGATCSPGAKQCGGNAVLACDAAGSAYVLETPCGAGVCVEAGGSARCDTPATPPACPSEGKLCAGDCVAPDVSNGCGDATCMPCPAVEHGSPVCREGRCDADCEAGFVRDDAGCSPPPATCTDGVSNGGESDVDCGGRCPRCDSGKACTRGADCTTAACVNGTCSTASCTNNVQDSAESDLDCGGPRCEACAIDARCNSGKDCTEGSCVESRCRAPTCSDRVQNGAESGTDCGGPVCGKCGPGMTCKASEDCTSGVCASGLCRVATCADKVYNGTETDTDCGGFCPKCGPGLACSSGTDCTSGVCENDTCKPASCDDGVKNGDETAADCGGSCGPCPTGSACTADTDCESGHCDAKACRVPCPTSGSTDCPKCSASSAYAACCRSDGYCGCSILGLSCTL